MRNKSVFVFVAVCLFTWAVADVVQAAVDREKLLKDTGVYATFAVFKVEGDWWKLDKAARSAAAAEVKAVFQKHADSIATDTYLLRGLSEKADFFVRVHSTEMLHNQNFLVGSKPYVIVVPIRKDAEWWNTAQDSRGKMMKEHTEATVSYLKTVKRKLYHASGLDDLDFITYFETAKLDDFNSLVIGLERVKENRHNKQFGHPTLLGTIRPLDEILEILSR